MYYPKTKIIPDQYTNGNELVYLHTNTVYQGYYHILANGRIFTGKNSNDGIPRELERITPGTERTLSSVEITALPIEDLYQMEPSNTEYDRIRIKTTGQTAVKTLKEPQYSIPTPAYPSFIRYFVKRVNNNIYLEINKGTYESLISKNSLYNWPAYFPFSLPWTTVGSSKQAIYTINRDIVLLTEQRLNLYGFSQYITNYTEFA